MAEIIHLDTPEFLWERLCAAVRRCQREQTDANKRAVQDAEAAYVEAARAQKGTAA